MAFTIPAVALGEGHAVMFLLPPTIPGQDEVDEIVRRVVQGLIETRSMAAQQTLAQSNGKGHVQGPASGLILPGR